MASVTRLSNSALRASLRAPAFNGAAFNASRCYSAKAQVSCIAKHMTTCCLLKLKGFKANMNRMCILK